MRQVDVALIDRDRARDYLAVSAEKPGARQKRTHRLRFARMPPRGGRTHQNGDTGIDSDFVWSLARLPPIRARGTLRFDVEEAFADGEVAPEFGA